MNKERLELLELERREAIGEILKLNPSYKPPSDYKPLLKEAEVPIPIKEYPGHNFIGLIFGPANDTHKRLEKETGARVRVYATKADKKEKFEVTYSEGRETENAYGELSVHVSADTYEKVDAAVALIELLVTTVSVNPASASTTSTVVSGDNVNVINPSLTEHSSLSSPVVNQGVAQPTTGSASAPAEVHLQQYPVSWFPVGISQNPIPSPSGFITSANHSAPLVSNPIQMPSSSSNAANMPSLFGSQPLAVTGFGSASQNPPSLVPSRPQIPQVLQPPYMPQAPPLGHSGAPRIPLNPLLQTAPNPPNFAMSPQFSGNQPTQTPLPQNVRPFVSSLPQSASAATFSGVPLTPSVSSMGWSQTPLNAQGPSNMTSMVPPMVAPQGQHPVASQAMVVSGAPQITRPVSSTASPMPVNPMSANGAVNRPNVGLAFSAVSQSQAGVSPALLQPSPITQIKPVMPHGAMPSLSPNSMPGPNHSPLPIASTLTPPPRPSGISNTVPANVTSFNPLRPPSVTAPRPQQPNPGDFTFQPHRPQSPASQVFPRPSSQIVPQNVASSNQAVLPPRPSIQLAMQNPNLSPAIQGFGRQQVNNQMGQLRAPVSLDFAGSPTAPLHPHQRPAFPTAGALSPTIPQMRPRSVNPAASVHSAGTFPPMQLQQNALNRPQNFTAANPPLTTNLPHNPSRPAVGSAPQQFYDPFLPSSATNAQLGGNRAKIQQESDPEYEDLMASVGVK